MTSRKQRKAAKHNIKKAQEKWGSMGKRARSRAQPEGRSRRKPGSKKDTGDYYHVEVRDKNQFKSFRTHDVGRKGHTQRVAGRRERGSWSTQKWLIGKKDAHVKNGYLIADEEGVKKVLDQLGSKPRRIKGDIFKARPRPNVPEKDKPTYSQKKARKRNIKKSAEKPGRPQAI